MRSLLVLLCCVGLVTAQASFVTVNICEGGKGDIGCPAGQVMVIQRAYYGRKDPSKCPGKNTNYTECEATNSEAYIKNACGGHQSCYLVSSNDTFGRDPCEDTTKYTHVEYYCHAL
ncbi:D-galactoside-specific lectin-like [Ciona intestinalis]